MANAYPLGDEAGGGGRAIDRSQDPQIVARRHPTVRAHNPLETSTLAIGHVLGPPRIDTKGIVAVEIAHRQIVRVDMLAGPDRLGGEAEDLAVFAHRLARRDRAGRDLVAGPDRPA